MKHVILLLTVIVTLFLFTGCPDAPGIISETYSISYDANGADSGSVPVDSTGYLDGAKVVISDNTGSLSKSAYTFAGWNTSADGSGTTYTGGTTLTMGAGNVSLYAVWAQNTHIITFNANGGTGTMAAQRVAEGAAAVLLSSSFNRTGYSFAGWATTASGSSEYSDGSSYTMETTDVTLYAVWSRNTRTITFNVNGGVGTTVTQTGYENEGVALLPNTYSREGFKFKGWSATSGGTADYPDESIYVLGTSDATLYAVWRFSLISRWAKSTVTGPDNSEFNAVDTGLMGVYAAGSQWGTKTYSYGNDASATGGNSAKNAVLVAYDSQGAKWAKSVNGPDTSVYNAVVTDNADIYAAGYQEGAGTFSYGSMSATGTATVHNPNSVVAKYDHWSGVEWVSTISAGTSGAAFESVALGTASFLYAAGFQYGNETYTYGDKSISSDQDVSNVLVNYNKTNGNVYWAKGPSPSSGTVSGFVSVAADSSGNIYTAGYQNGTVKYEYGDGVGVAGSNSGTNVLLVKYDYSGKTIWARSLTGGSDYSCFFSVALDSSRNVYASGVQTGTGVYSYGSGVSVSGAHTGKNAVLVKYSSSGTALWARSVSAGSDVSEFKAVTVDENDIIYAAGTQKGSGTYTYGNGVSVAANTTSGVHSNSVLVAYDGAGNALSAKSISAGSSSTYYNSITADGSGKVYAAGSLTGTTEFTYEDEAKVTGSYQQFNSALVQYGH